MTDFLPLLLVLACPLGMASMMFLPSMARRLGRRSPSTDTAS